MSKILSRPDPAEYPPYYSQYIQKAPDGDILHILAEQLEETRRFLDSLTDAQAERRYAPGKWSIKEIIGHLADSERIFAYRALRFARNDATDLPGFEQDAYVAAANFQQRTLSDIAEELGYLRRSSIALFRGLDDEALARSGAADGKRITVRTMPYILAGHELHHLQVIRERYV